MRRHVKGLENYLSTAKKTLEQHREDLTPAAVDRVKAYLTMSKIAEMENISVSDEELDDAVENMAKSDETKTQNVRTLFGMPQARESLREMIAINKCMELLTSIVTGQTK
jgi:trigger factor